MEGSLEHADLTPGQAADECLTVPGCLEWTSSFFPEEIALADDDRCIRYRELDDNTRAAAAYLLSRWITPGDKVAVIGENSAAHMQVLYSVFRSGACLVPLSTFLSSDAAARILDDAGVRLVIAVGDYLAVAQKAVGLSNSRPNLIGLNELELAAQTQPRVSLPDIDPSSDAIIVYSSGTTGAPKGVVGTHTLRALQTKGFATLGAEPGRYTLLSTPIASNWTLAGLFSTLWNGGAVYITKRFSASDFTGLAERLQPKITFLVPTQVERLLEEPSTAAASFARDSIKLCAGSPIAPEKKLAFHQAWPGSFIEIYSMTESTVTCSLDVGQHPGKVRSVGLPADGYRIAILDEDDREVAPGEVGEIAGWSQYMMKAYFKREAATAELRWKHPDGTVFHRTGDLGFLDDDGFLYISGRKKDMIITGGFNVYPSDIEEILCQHPDVKEAAVVGLPSHRWGETPFAVITCRKTRVALDSELLNWANERLGKTQRLSGLDIVDQLPRGSLQKVLKAELRREYAAKIEGETAQEEQGI